MALDHVLIVGDAHTGQVLATDQRHYNQHRSHPAHNQLPSEADQLPATVYDLQGRTLMRTRVISGVINKYRYAP